MEDIALELDSFYCAWNIINGIYTTPISKKIISLISQQIENSEVILEINKEDKFNYKMSFFKHIDIIIIYNINKLNDIPNYYKGRVIIHSLEKINNNLLKRKGFEIIEKFEYTTIRAYNNIGLFLYHLESEPWYLKNSDILSQNLDNLYKNFKLNNKITVARYLISLILNKKEK